MSNRRSKLFLKITLVLIATIILGCGSLNEQVKVFQPLTPKSKKAMKKIAVVSDMGISFKGEFAGTAGLGRKSFRYNFSQYDIDTKIEEKIADRLTTNSGLNADTRADMRFSINVNPRDMSHQNLLKQLSPMLQQLKSENIDTAVVVTPWIAGGEGFEMISGYGYGQGFDLNNDYSTDSPQVFFFSRINVVNVAKNKLILDSYLNRTYPIKIDKWHSTFEDYSPEEQQQMRDLILKTVDEELAGYLEKMNF
jgi:hypothetical protein